MKLVVLWTHVSSYMGACWRALGGYDDIDLRVLAWRTSLARDHVGFDESVVAGVRGLTLLEEGDVGLEGHVQGILEREKPDVVLVAGWGTVAYRRVLSRWRYGEGKVPKVLMGMDTPWRGEWKQYVARVRLWRYLRVIDRVLVAGPDAGVYAGRLGFKPGVVESGIYAWDESMAKRLLDHDVRERRRAFLFVGRYVSQKGVDVLLDGYRRYRERVENPWDLWCCGAGPLAQLFRGQEGVTDYGFVQPSELPEYFGAAGIFVLPSFYEPWGVVIAEAMGCGLPVICTDRCGAGWDLVEEGRTGVMIKAGDPEGLARAMERSDGWWDSLEVMRNAARVASERFTSAAWGARVRRIAREMVYGEEG
jgi:glycosyltransferase involved in cell wall biosynthesis